MNSFTLTKQDTSVMKGIAICAMLLHHLYGCPPEGVLPYSGAIEWLGVLGKVCVSIFLFCSGYGLSVQYNPQSLKDDFKFIARRICKFYVNYWVIFIIFVPISLIVFHTPESAYNQEVWKNPICLLLDIFGLENSYNTTWWFNATIIELYILFPLLYRLIRLKPWVALLLSMILVRLDNHIPIDTIWQLPFVAGIVWQLYETSLPKFSTWLADHKIIFALCSIMALVIAILLRMYPIIPHWSAERMDVFVTGALALVVLSIIRNIPYVATSFSFLGKHSMNVYMVHTFFNAYWFSHLFHNCEYMRGGGNFILLIIICLLVSMAIEYVKEKCGLNNLVKRLINKIA